MEKRDLIGSTQNRQYFCKVEKCPERAILKEDYRLATSHANEHVDTDKKNFKCGICPSYFINEKQLIHHMKSHVYIPTTTTHARIDDDTDEKNRLFFLAKDFKDIFDVEYNYLEYIQKVDRIIKDRNYSEQQVLWFKKRFGEAVEYVKDNAIKKIEVPSNIFDVKKHIEINYLKKLMLNSSVDLNKDLMKQPEALKTLRNIILNEMHTILSKYSFKGINAFVADNSYKYTQILYYIENYRKKLVESFAYIGEPRTDVKDAINFLVEMQREKEKEPANILVGMKRKRSDEDDYGGRVKSRRNRSKSRRKKSNRRKKSKKNKSRRKKSKKGKSRRKKSKKSKKGKSRRKKSKY